jgi:hypothetical protein
MDDPPHVHGRINNNQINLVIWKGHYLSHGLNNIGLHYMSFKKPCRTSKFHEEKMAKIIGAYIFLKNLSTSWI